MFGLSSHQAKGFDFVVVSVHLKATGLDNEDLSRLQVTKPLMVALRIPAMNMDKLPQTTNLIPKR